jgi:type IV secretory pathway VirB2 component (pilin)
MRKPVGNPLSRIGGFLYRHRAVVLMFAICLSFAIPAHAQSDPFTTATQTVETMLTGTFAKIFVVICMIVAAIPIALGKAGDHKGTLIGVVFGCIIILSAQTVVTWLIPVG